ncbi:hypothetical protein [Senegalia massiliensis]|jgi:hypothetical protein|uniref:hypothetical protein n=1 Tax=Senegalia massiliensis TaxID=1720316 RepID=UPI0010307BD6|nr:hypothetical protein [Senegalia massiliensis]
MEEFPIIHTNLWDAIIAVPTVVVVTQIIKIFFSIKGIYVPSIANLIGLIISIFFAHKQDLSAGIFMGLFYGNAAVGVYSSIKTTWKSYKKRHINKS